MELATGILVLATVAFDAHGAVELTEFSHKEPVKMEVCLEASRNTNNDLREYDMYSYCRDHKGSVHLSGPIPEAK